MECDLQSIQQSIGVCPQEDLLWDDLSAREHMTIHARFKGINIGPQLTSAIESVLSQVPLVLICVRVIVCVC